MPAERPARTPRISSFGSTATTSAKREARARVSFPEPAARSTTRESALRPSTSAARSSASGAYSGRTSSYSAAIRPKLKASSDTARPVGDRADAAVYLAVGGHELAQAACERGPVLLGLVRDRADREQVRDPLVARVRGSRARPRPRAAPRTGRPRPAGAIRPRARAAGLARRRARTPRRSRPRPRRRRTRTRPGCSRRSRARRAVATRARSRRPTRPLANQWNASPEKTASTLASASGIDSPRPASASAPGTTSSSTARIASSGSTATTRANRGTSSRVSLPVPAPRSSTSAAGPRPSSAITWSSSSTGQPGRPSSYSRAVRPNASGGASLVAFAFSAGLDRPLISDGHTSRAHAS